MARVKQTARKSTGGKAPRRALVLHDNLTHNEALERNKICYKISLIEQKLDQATDDDEIMHLQDGLAMKKNELNTFWENVSARYMRQAAKEAEDEEDEDVEESYSANPSSSSSSHHHHPHGELKPVEGPKPATQPVKKAAAAKKPVEAPRPATQPVKKPKHETNEQYRSRMLKVGKTDKKGRSW